MINLIQEYKGLLNLKKKKKKKNKNIKRMICNRILKQMKDRAHIFIKNMSYCPGLIMLFRENDYKKLLYKLKNSEHVYGNLTENEFTAFFNKSIKDKVFIVRVEESNTDQLTLLRNSKLLVNGDRTVNIKYKIELDEIKTSKKSANNKHEYINHISYTIRNLGYVHEYEKQEFEKEYIKT